MNNFLQAPVTDLAMICSESTHMKATTAQPAFSLLPCHFSRAERTRRVFDTTIRFAWESTHSLLIVPQWNRRLLGTRKWMFNSCGLRFLLHTIFGCACAVVVDYKESSITT